MSTGAKNVFGPHSDARTSCIKGLIQFLLNPEERANEDLAISYFRYIYGTRFSRQEDAQGADGYVPGSLVLELKTKPSDWLSGFFQALSYRRLGLDFGQIVVATRSFLAVWRLEDLDPALIAKVMAEKGSPSSAGRTLSRSEKSSSRSILTSAVWNASDFLGDLLSSSIPLVAEKLASFEETLKRGIKVRTRITSRSFVNVLPQMKQYFDPDHPIRAVRAFYSMIYAWNEGSVLALSNKSTTEATLGGELVTDLLPSNRKAFKEFVENHFVWLGQDENIDEFFSRYDEAIDAVDKNYRIKHGMFFTDPDLARFVMWFVRKYVPDLGREYLVIDPACGSGNLVTNWRSPLDIRHKVVSEIEPELLFAVEKRMKGDRWHQGKFTVVPRVDEKRGLNFLDRSATEYLAEITKHLAEKGQKADRPIAFLCNPPYRSDDDQTANGAGYAVHHTVRELVGNDAEKERYCCFLAQMKLICDAAEHSSRQGESLLLLFTKAAWMTNRAIFENIRTAILSSFEDVGGLLVDGSEFFSIKGSWPIAFTIWRYRGRQASLSATRSIPLIDLTWVRRKSLASIPWSNATLTDRTCEEIFDDVQATTVLLGSQRESIRTWSGVSMVDFKRDRRVDEVDKKLVGGLPRGDRRLNGKKAYGEANGAYVGFMDDLTPCRVKRSAEGVPWFRLNAQFMDVKKNRCFSGPPTNRGMAAKDIAIFKRLSLWYAFTRSVLQCGYPMWADAEDIWAFDLEERDESELTSLSFAITFAENECVTTSFPANNPRAGLPEVYVSNPLTPLDSESYWCSVLEPTCEENDPGAACELIAAVKDVFGEMGQCCWS